MVYDFHITFGAVCAVRMCPECILGKVTDWVLVDFSYIADKNMNISPRQRTQNISGYHQV
jgi:hypothetical protein